MGGPSRDSRVEPKGARTSIGRAKRASFEMQCHQGRGVPVTKTQTALHALGINARHLYCRVNAVRGGKLNAQLWPGRP